MTKKQAIKILLLFIGTTLISYCLFINYLRTSEIGLARNFFSNRVWMQEKKGFNITLPWVQVARVDINPMRVSIDSGGKGYSAKLVQFDPRYWEDFVKTEGWRYYWWTNRLSFNWGYKEEHRGMKDILRGYAYDSREYPFVVCISKY